MAGGTGSGWDAPGAVHAPGPSVGGGLGTGWESPGGVISAPHAAAPGGGHGILNDVGGFLGGAGHWIASKASLAGHDIKGVAGGALVGVKPWYELATTGHPYAHGTGGQVDAATHQFIGGIDASLNEAVHHPLRDPFNTLTWALPIAHGVARGGIGGVEAAGKIRAGEGVQAAADAFKNPTLLHTPRLLRLTPDGKPVSLAESHNAVRRLYQAAHDSYVQKMIDTKPNSVVAKYGYSRVQGSMAEVARARVRMRQAVVSNLRRSTQPLKGEIAKAAKKAGVELTNSPKTIAQAAVELTQHNTTPDEAIMRAEHALETAREAIANPDTPPEMLPHLHEAVALNEANRGLYGEVARLDLVHNHGPTVGINPEFKNLHRSEGILSDNGNAIDTEIAARGLRPEEQLTNRKDLPAAVTTRMEPFREQVVTPTLRRAREDFARVDRAYSRALKQEHEWHYKSTEDVADVLTPGRVGGRSVALDNPYRERVNNLGERHQAALERVQRLEKNLYTGPESAGDLKPTLEPDEVTREAIQALHKKLPELLKRKIERNYGGAASHAAVREYRDLERRVTAAERRVEAAHGPADLSNNPVDYEHWQDWSRARGYTNAEIEDFQKWQDINKRLGITEPDMKPTNEHPFGMSTEGLLAAARTQRFADDMVHAANGTLTDPAAVRMLHQLTQATLEGKTFTPLTTLDRGVSGSPMPMPRGTVVGEPSDPLNRHHTSGSGLLGGHHQADVAEAVADHWHRVFRFFNRQDWQQEVARTGYDANRTKDDILVRDDGRVSGGEFNPHAVGKITQEAEEFLGRVRDRGYTPEMEAEDAGIVSSLQQFVDHLFPGRQPGTEAAALEERARGGATGMAAPKGYKWVPKQVVGDLNIPVKATSGIAYHVGNFFDNVNSAVTAATVYFKLGHFGTRYLTNAATSLMQGSASPLNLRETAKIAHELTPDEKLDALASAGTHYYEALPGAEGEGRISRIIQGGIPGTKTHVMSPQWWAGYVDAPFRLNSLVFEVRKSGSYADGVEGMRQYLDDLKNYNHLDDERRALVDGVVRRANREAIAYDRMNDFEKRYLARAVWFYPWVKGSTVWTANAMLEHPFKSLAVGQLGYQGRKAQESELGDVPSYSYGIFLFAHGTPFPLVADFNTFNPEGTAADLLQMPAHLDDAAGMLNPALGGFEHLITSTDELGNHTNNPVGAALRSAVGATPESQILTALLDRHADQSHREYPAVPGDPFSKTYLGQILRALIGPGTPRRFNPEAAHSLAERERTGR